MTAYAAGWVVVHAIWVGLLARNAATLALARVRQPRARYVLVYTALLVTIGLPMLIVLSGVDFFTEGRRSTATALVDSSVGFAAFVDWRGRIVRAAAIVWTAGAVVAALRVWMAWRRLSVIRRTPGVDTGSSMQAVVADLRGTLAVSQPVSVLVSPAAEVPMVFGWTRPVIVLPVDSTLNLGADQVKAVLAHELAHVRRGDYLANLLQVAVDVLLWFHPSVRWLSRRARIEREYCCDDVAVRITGDPRGYAHALAALEDARHACPLAVAAASGTLLDRIERIVGRPRPAITLRRAAAALAGAAVVAIVVAALSQVVPPSIPLDAGLRTRSAAPAGAPLAAPAPGPLRTPRR